ncbi:hypothetical protein Clacol_007506 [Clathrus columnatus]|uniref:Uncharacterized protein n=1 Tax=Clathrus columnatus TaxID=1419009 RepID=A0AAV5AMV4_9AGAM|nr:hypothetical protein Clacol_007506 [Clathrus columnatus]
MPFNGVANLPDGQRRSTKSSVTTPHHDSSKLKSKSKSKSSAPTPPVLPFMQEMQLLQVLEGGRLEDHIRRHHKHFGDGALEEARDYNFKDGDKSSVNGPRGYTVTDERGMMWFDEEEQWEFKELLPKEDEAIRGDAVPQPAVTQKQTGLRKLFGASKKPTYVITGWETFDQSGRLDEDQTDDENGGISPGVTDKLGFASLPEYNAVFDKRIRRGATSFQCGYVSQNEALKLPPPPPHTSRKKHPVVTHTSTDGIPSTLSTTSNRTMTHNQLKKEFLAQAFTPSVSLPASRSHTPTSNSQISLLPASRSQSSLALPSSNSSRSVSPFARLRTGKANTSGTKSGFGK